MWLPSQNEFTVSEEVANRLVGDVSPDFSCTWTMKPSQNVVTNHYYAIGEEIFISSCGEIDFFAFIDVIYSGNKGIMRALEKQINIERNMGTGDDILIEEIKGIDEIKFLPIEIERENV